MTFETADGARTSREREDALRDYLREKALRAQRAAEPRDALEVQNFRRERSATKRLDKAGPRKEKRVISTDWTTDTDARARLGIAGGDPNWQPKHLRNRLSNDEILERAKYRVVTPKQPAGNAKPNLNRSNKKRKPERIIGLHSEHGRMNPANLDAIVFGPPKAVHRA